MGRPQRDLAAEDAAAREALAAWVPLAAPPCLTEGQWHDVLAQSEAMVDLIVSLPGRGTPQSSLTGTGSASVSSTAPVPAGTPGTTPTPSDARKPAPDDERDVAYD